MYIYTIECVYVCVICIYIYILILFVSAVHVHVSFLTECTSTSQYVYTLFCFYLCITYACITMETDSNIQEEILYSEMNITDYKPDQLWEHWDFCYSFQEQ